MDEATYKSLSSRAKLMRSLCVGTFEADWWAGYQRGLLHHYHGERFGTDDEHRVWMSLADDADVSRNMRGLGYRAGLVGEWAEPPQDDAEQADRP